MTESILFACSANVCRSPLMLYTCGHEVYGSQPWVLKSAGTAAQIGSPMCATSLSLVPSGSQDSAATHAAGAVDEAALDASLIIVASRQERTAIARAKPEARHRLFTLTEAVMLGQLALSKPARIVESEGATERFAQLIDAQRGLITIPRDKKRSRLFRYSPKSHPFDIPDAHHSTRFAHMKTLKRVRAEAIELAALISKLQVKSF